MDKERAKDLSWDVVGTVVEAGASAVPVVGGPVAVLVNRAFHLRVQARNDRIMKQIQDDITNLVERTKLADTEALIDSEPFMAALHRTFRASQETPSDEKRKLLRNALLNGYVASDPPQQRNRFLALMTRYEPEHVLVLRTIQELMAGRTEMMEHAAHLIREALKKQGVEVSVAGALDELAADGLVSRNSENRVEEVNIGNKWGTPQKRQIAKPVVWHTISAGGVAFLKFVAEPLAD